MTMRITRSRGHCGFTLMEVLIASGILMTCLFAVLMLTSNSLVTARMLQQHKSVDTSTISSLIYVMLANTNRLDEGEIPVDLTDVLPDYKCEAYLTAKGTNGLGEIDYLVTRGGKLEATNIFFMYLPNLKVGGISSTLPQH
jgi:Tfp pilus assembly protein PilV